MDLNTKSLNEAKNVVRLKHLQTKSFSANILILGTNNMIIQKLTEQYYDKTYALSQKYSFVNTKSNANSILRPITKEDLDCISIAIIDDEVAGLIKHRVLKGTEDEMFHEKNKKQCVYIGKLVVDEKYRGQGLAKKLLKYAMSTPNIKRYYTIISYAPERNWASDKLFTSVGFVPFEIYLDTNDNTYSQKYKLIIEE